ncbi:MAG: hypothetical protein ACYC7E_05075 [Armatimonadota bacterium]
MSTPKPQSSAGIEMRDGRPVLVLDGQVLSQAIYCDPMIRNDEKFPERLPERWLERARAFRDSGVHTHTIMTDYNVGGFYTQGQYWVDDGIFLDEPLNPEAYDLDKQATALLEMDPEARLIVRFFDQWPGGFIEKHPDEIQLGSTPRKNYNFPQPSMASQAALDGLCRFIRNLVIYSQNKPWSHRVIAYTYLPMGEGVPTINVDGLAFDICPAMQREFRAWVRRGYANEAALQAAWGDPEITFDNVGVPTEDEWHTARAQCEHWIEGNQLQPMRDYFALQRELFLRWYRQIIRAVREALTTHPALFAMDICKQPLFGWQHNLSFEGYGPSGDFLDMLYTAGSIDVAELLDEPGLDALITPADYTDRMVGYGWESEGIADSLHLRGKTILVENDARTFVDGQRRQQGAFRTVTEARAGLLRNSAWAVTRGHIEYWMLSGGIFFHDPELQRQAIAPATQIFDAAAHWPHVETEHAVAMIIDDTAARHTDGTSAYHNLAVMWQRVLGLAHCGIPYRIYLLSDLERENMPDYRCYFFPNLFEMNAKRLALLQRKVFRDGRMAIFGPATGITDGTTLSAEWASRVLGVEMELVRKHAPRRVIVEGTHPVVRALPAATVYGDSQPYGPVLIPAENAEADFLGMATITWAINRPGLFIKEHGTHKVAWSAAMPLPANLLRELACEGGCHVWCEEDDVILASDTVAAIHAVKPGPRTLYFPSPRTVWDLLSWEKIGDNLSEVALDINPPETRLFYFGDKPR